MLNILAQNILLDPIVALELLTLLCTFYYIARISISEFAPLVEAASPGEALHYAGLNCFTSTVQAARSHKSTSSSLRRTLRSFFEVGELISQPKSSLKGQRRSRRA